MPPHPFVDHVKIFFRSGKGGDGHVGWRREKFEARGGPEGGDGGDGGSIILKGNPQLWTLLDLKYHKHIRAENGQNGAKMRKTGKKGKDIVLEVPLGTTVKDSETGEFLGEIKEEGETLLLLQGGHGGRGNWHFRSSTNQTPEHAEPGWPGQELTAIIELKIMADVGLVGFPNAGKSTLLSVVTAAKPKIGAYPFTTLVPNLGIVKYRDTSSFVMADIPGIIEGAAEGRGLGLRFLRHVERNSILLFVLPADSEDLGAEFDILLKELHTYDDALKTKEIIIGISKADLIGEEGLKGMENLPDRYEIVQFSAITRQGLPELLDAIWRGLQRATAPFQDF